MHLMLPSGSPLLPGMTTEVNIVIREEDSALLIHTGDAIGEVVWTIDAQDRVRARQVRIGAVGAEQTEILSGLDETDWVIAQPAGDLVEGKEMQVVREEN